MLRNNIMMLRCIITALCIILLISKESNAQQQPDWHAIAMTFRQQRDQANDELAQLKVQSDSQLALMAKKSAEVNIYWENYIKGMSSKPKSSQ